jgi:ferredoxin-type protein NapH
LLFWRRCCQTIIALGFIVVPLCNVRGITVISGNLLSLEFFGVTFIEPLALLQTLAGGWPTAKALTGAALVLLIAFLLGRVFCSWMCPYGLASELVFAIRGKRRARIRAETALAHDAGIRPFATRVAVTALGLLAVLLFLSDPCLNQLSMPGWYTRALQHTAFFGFPPLYGVLLFVAPLLLEGFTGSRFWCRCLCPQATLLALAAVLSRSGLRLRFTHKQCACAGNDRPCLTACSLALNPREITFVQRLDCTNCGNCVDVCRLRGKALRLSLRDGTSAVATQAGM